MSIDSAKLNNWIQIIGIIAVVLSLIFVGMQMRQTQDIAIATLYQMRSDSARELGAIMINNPDLMTFYRTIYADGIESLDPDDVQLLVFTTETMLGHFENSHHLYQLGFLSKEQWEADLRQIRQIVGPVREHIWTDRRRDTFRDSFAEEIDAILNEQK